VQPADNLSILGTAVGLSMDAFAVAIMASTMLPAITPRHLFRLAFHFGLFQALMPAIGWAAGISLKEALRFWDHWIAFGLLFLVGVRAIQAAFSRNGAPFLPGDPTRGLALVALSVATSLDALAVGVTFAVLGVKILVPVVVIGLVATAMTALGMLIGRRVGRAFGKKAQLLGGIVLIGIGLKILVQDLVG
jgi:putative Mn2+ efflux pump MntP